jgi:hypothetical protein
MGKSARVFVSDMPFQPNVVPHSSLSILSKWLMFNFITSPTIANISLIHLLAYHTVVILSKLCLKTFDILQNLSKKINRIFQKSFRSFCPEIFKIHLQDESLNKENSCKQ